MDFIKIKENCIGARRPGSATSRLDQRYEKKEDSVDVFVAKIIALFSPFLTSASDIRVIKLQEHLAEILKNFKGVCK